MILKNSLTLFFFDKIFIFCQPNHLSEKKYIYRGKKKFDKNRSKLKKYKKHKSGSVQGN